MYTHMHMCTLFMEPCIMPFFIKSVSSPTEDEHLGTPTQKPFGLSNNSQRADPPTLFTWRWQKKTSDSGPSRKT